jgi:hypothetical protein
MLDVHCNTWLTQVDQKRHIRGGKNMARHYSSKDFFRQMPNALLARYFQGRGLFGDLDFATMKEGKPEELFRAWLGLSDGQRNEMDAEFRDIFEMNGRGLAKQEMVEMKGFEPSAYALRTHRSPI